MTDLILNLKQEKIDGILMDKGFFTPLLWEDEEISFIEMDMPATEFAVAFPKTAESEPLKAQMNEFIQKYNLDKNQYSAEFDLAYQGILAAYERIKEMKVTKVQAKPDKTFVTEADLIVEEVLINAIKKIDNANKVDVFVAYSLFSNGVKEFTKLAKSGKLNKLYISNLIHVDKKILKHKFIEVINTDEFVSKIIREV